MTDSFSGIVTSAQWGCKVLWSACLSVGMFVCPLRNRTSKFQQIFYTCYLWPWLGSSLMAMRYVMFVWICGWRNKANGLNPRWHVSSRSPGGGTGEYKQRKLINIYIHKNCATTNRLSNSLQIVIIIIWDWIMCLWTGLRVLLPASSSNWCGWWRHFCHCWWCWLVGTCAVVAVPHHLTVIPVLIHHQSAATKHSVPIP